MVNPIAREAYGGVSLNLIQKVLAVANLSGGEGFSVTAGEVAAAGHDRQAFFLHVSSMNLKLWNAQLLCIYIYMYRATTAETFWHCNDPSVRPVNLHLEDVV